VIFTVFGRNISTTCPQNAHINQSNNSVAQSAVIGHTLPSKSGSKSFCSSVYGTCTVQQEDCVVQAEMAIQRWHELHAGGNAALASRFVLQLQQDNVEVLRSWKLRVAEPTQQQCGTVCYKQVSISVMHCHRLNHNTKKIRN